jgi:hypothetical protein
MQETGCFQALLTTMNSRFTLTFGEAITIASTPSCGALRPEEHAPIAREAT